MSQTYWLETLGCPKNQVDSDKLAGQFAGDGLLPAVSAEDADVVVVNTCAFIEAARTESIDTVLALADLKRDDARLVVTGCMAERYGEELAAALPEVDQVAGFGVPITPPKLAGTPVSLGTTRRDEVPSLDLLNMVRPATSVPWAYVKVAEGCDRKCGFCAIPSFRGKQRSRDEASILAEVEKLNVPEIILIAQDLASYGSDLNRRGAISNLVREVLQRTERVRLLYLYPSDLSDALIDVICETGVPYFDLSLQHVSKPLLRRMRRWGDGDRFLRRIEDIRRREPNAAFRSNFIVGYPGETEEDHDQLRSFVQEADMEWISFFAYSPEDGTYAYDLDGAVPAELMNERLRELRSIQDEITATKRAHLIGERIEVLVDASGVARSHREAPEIDGIIEVPKDLEVGSFAKVEIVAAAGPDLEAVSRVIDAPSIRPTGAETTRTFDPANGVTAIRIALAPIVVAFIWFYAPAWWVLAFGFLAMITDQLDGWLARRYGSTDVGKMLDPIADKLMVLGALGALVLKDWVWWVPVAIIAAREIAMSWWRTRLAQQGVFISARRLAKWKTWTQSIAVALALTPGVIDNHNWLLDAAIWISVFMTLFTFGQYLNDGRNRAKAL